MKTISFSELYKTDYNLKKLFVMEQRWNNHAVFNTVHTPRPTNCLLFLCGYDAVYTRKDLSALNAQNGSVIYVPQGAEYKVEFIQTVKSGAHTVLIEFEMLDAGNTLLTAASDITVLDANPGPVMTDLFYEMFNLYTRPIVSYAMLKSILYRILSEYSSQFHSVNIFSKEFRSIAKGILYLEKNTSQSLSVREIADMCHVSENCFRRLFRKYSGMSPVAYQTNIKIDYAKKLLQGNSMKVSEIAAMLGYEDPAYFCRLFKKITGYTPTGYVHNR